MESLIKDALNETQVPEKIVEEVEIQAKLELINESGEVFINFSPSIAVVPNDWDTLWDLSEREKLSPADRERYEDELKEIMNVEFI